MVTLSLQCLHLSLFYHDERLLLSSKTYQSYHYITIKTNDSPHLAIQSLEDLVVYCKFYVAARAFIVKQVLTYESTTTLTIRLSLLHPARGPLLQMPSYVSVHVRSVGGRFVKQFHRCE